MSHLDTHEINYKWSICYQGSELENWNMYPYKISHPANLQPKYWQSKTPWQKSCVLMKYSDSGHPSLNTCGYSQMQQLLQNASLLRNWCKKTVSEVVLEAQWTTMDYIRVERDCHTQIYIQLKRPIRQEWDQKNRVRLVRRIYGMKYSWKGHKDRNSHKNRTKKEWASSDCLCQKYKQQHPHHMKASPQGHAKRKYVTENKLFFFLILWDICLGLRICHLWWVKDKPLFSWISFFFFSVPPPPPNQLYIKNFASNGRKLVENNKTMKRKVLLSWSRTVEQKRRFFGVRLFARISHVQNPLLSFSLIMCDSN